MKKLFFFVVIMIFCACSEEERVGNTSPIPSWPPGLDVQEKSLSQEREVLFLVSALSDYEEASRELLDQAVEVQSLDVLSSDFVSLSSNSIDGAAKLPLIPNIYAGSLATLIGHLDSEDCVAVKIDGNVPSVKSDGKDCELRWSRSRKYVENKKQDTTQAVVSIESEYQVGPNFSVQFGIKEFVNQGEGEHSFVVNPDGSYSLKGSGSSIGSGVFFGRSVEVKGSIEVENFRNVVDRDSNGRPVFFEEKHNLVRNFEIFVEGKKRGHFAVLQTWDGVNQRETKVAFNGRELDDQWKAGQWTFFDLLENLLNLELPLVVPTAPIPKRN